jgi:Inner membrane protein YgaP-like, transmembrane domain
MLVKNEGTADRVVRAVVGGGLIAVSATTLGLGSGKPLGVAVALVGGVLLFTAAAGSCLLYRPFGIDTSR